MEIQALIEKRGALAKQMQDLLKEVNGDVSKWDAEARNKYNKIEEEYDNVSESQKVVERQAARESELRSITTTKPVELPPATPGAAVESRAKEEAEARKLEAFQRYLLRGASALNETEYRALAADQDIYGGFLVPPVQTVKSLLKKVDDLVFIRKLATVEQVSQAASLGQPTLVADPSDATWTAEIATGSEDSTMSFGGRELHPHPLAKRIKISAKLLRVASMNVESIVMDRMAYKFAIVEENAFLTGDGNNKPLGVFTASTKGISTSRDVSTDNTTTAITADNLINVKYSLKAGYLPGCVWLFHRDAIKMIRKLKDSQGQYVWQPGLQQGQPDRILDHPFYMSEYVPNTFTTGLYVGLFGNFRYYMIAEALNMQVQRLTELYAEQNQIGYIARRELDGLPMLEDAFTRIKLA